MHLKAIPTRERGALVSTEATTIPLFKVVVFTGSLGRTGNSVCGLAFDAAWAAKPRWIQNNSNIYIYLEYIGIA